MSLKAVKKLTDKKYRNESGRFIVEGEKSIRELLVSDFQIEHIYGTEDFLDTLIPLVNAYDERHNTRIELTPAKQEDIERSGTLITNSTGIAVAKQRTEIGTETILKRAETEIILMLDDVRDPGNLGTIIRIADWFLIPDIIASHTTTDFYNPKTIGATMGSFTRIGVTYASLPETLEGARTQNIPIIVAVMDGESTHSTTLPTHGILLMGSESHGIAPEVAQYATHRLTIPRFGKAESLNVSVATGILLDTIRRR